MEEKCAWKRGFLECREVRSERWRGGLCGRKNGVSGGELFGRILCGGKTRQTYACVYSRARCIKVF